MSGRTNNVLRRLLPQGPAAACFALVALVAVAWLLAAVPAYRQAGRAGLLAAGIAAGVCLLSSMAALLVTNRFAGTPSAISGALGSILLRTIVPLGVTLFLVDASPVLAEAGLFGLTVVFYLLTLAGETLLAVRIVNAASRKPAGEPRSTEIRGMS
ncbi:MAG: hypothetical protein WED34_17610 [Planctomycetales bacterium]